MATKADVVRAMQKRLSKGERLYAESRRNGLTKSQRLAAVEERRRLSEEYTAAKERRAKLGRVKFNDLLDAAKFVCDVDGGEPSIDQLRVLVDKACVIREAEDECAEIRKAKDEAMGRSMRYKYRVSTVDPRSPLPMEFIIAEGDTWDDVLAKIEKR